MDKERLRTSMRNRRKALTEEEHLTLSLRAEKHLLESEVWRLADCVALYIAVRGELDTALLLQTAWRNGKTVLLPLCRPQQPGQMQLVPCPSADCLRPGAYGIPEPVAVCAASPAPVPQLIVTPGLAFDKQGVRLGMGGGYYDRLFAQQRYASSRRTGLCFNFQIVPLLTQAPWDVPVHSLCTENGLLEIPHATTTQPAP